MATREFAYELVTQGEQRLGANKIQCCRCPTAEFLTQTGSRRNPPDFIERYFRNKGWKVADRGDRDVCPTCMKVKPKPAAKAEPPPEMSRDDRRIVFTKIDDLYLDDRTGYAAPWTDAAVARDLGVPRAWVSQVRDELFGPEGSNAEYAEYAEFQKELAGLRDIQARLKGEIATAQATASEFDTKIAALQRTGAKIDREAGK